MAPDRCARALGQKDAPPPTTRGAREVNGPAGPLSADDVRAIFSLSGRLGRSPLVRPRSQVAGVRRVELSIEVRKT